MWIEYIKGLNQEYKFQPGIEISTIENVKRILNQEIPEEINTILKETNGVIGKHGFKLIYDYEEIIDTNITFRKDEDFKELYMPFDDIFFF